MSQNKTNITVGKQIDLTCCPTCNKVTCAKSAHCCRCGAKLMVRDHSSLQKSWALLITAAILLIPANLYPITTLTNQGRITQDTIFSGIIHLVKTDMLPIAIILFTASILVPILKIIGLATYLTAISFKLPISKKIS